LDLRRSDGRKLRKTTQISALTRLAAYPKTIYRTRLSAIVICSGVKKLPTSLRKGVTHELKCLSPYHTTAFRSPGMQIFCTKVLNIFLSLASRAMELLVLSLAPSGSAGACFGQGSLERGRTSPITIRSAISSLLPKSPSCLPLRIAKWLAEAPLKAEFLR
jgi:hypothetical protein